MLEYSSSSAIYVEAEERAGLIVAAEGATPRNRSGVVKLIDSLEPLATGNLESAGARERVRPPKGHTGQYSVISQVKRTEG